MNKKQNKKTKKIVSDSSDTIRRGRKKFRSVDTEKDEEQMYKCVNIHLKKCLSFFSCNLQKHLSRLSVMGKIHSKTQISDNFFKKEGERVRKKNIKFYTRNPWGTDNYVLFYGREQEYTVFLVVLLSLALVLQTSARISRIQFWLPPFAFLIREYFIVIHPFCYFINPSSKVILLRLWTTGNMLLLLWEKITCENVLVILPGHLLFFLCMYISHYFYGSCKREGLPLVKKTHLSFC